MAKHKYTVSGSVTVSTYTQVIAENEEEAKRLAQQHDMQVFCCSCASGESESEWVTSGELDGEPFDLEVEDDGEVEDED